MLAVGLTGGIATGKSTVTKMLTELGAVIIDSDVIARRVVEPGCIGLKRVVEEFGVEILKDDELDRSKLGGIIFSDAAARDKLNSIIHPLVKQEILARLAELKDLDQIVIIDVPLLFESGFDTLVDRTVVVYCPTQTQLERLMERNQLSEQAAWARIRSQISIDTKKALADYAIDNSRDLKSTRSQVEQLWKRWESENRANRP